METNHKKQSYISRYTDIFIHYLAQYMKTQMAYRADFLANLFSEMLQQLVNLIFIAVIFSKVPAIQEWSRDEVLFVYGFFLVPFAIYGGLFNHLFDVPEKYVLEGEFDRILVRPLNSWYQVVLETMQPELLFGSITGILLMIYSGSRMGLRLEWFDIPVGIVLVISATLIYAGVYTLLASIGFWSEGNMGLMPMVYNLSNYGRYPMTVYKGFVRFLLTWILPFAFVGFFPATVFLRRYDYLNYALLTPVIGILFFGIGIFVWNQGVKRYRGTGS